jgi:hypothetical protein
MCCYYNFFVETKLTVTSNLFYSVFVCRVFVLYLCICVFIYACVSLLIGLVF